MITAPHFSNDSIGWGGGGCQLVLRRDQDMTRIDLWSDPCWLIIYGYYGIDKVELYLHVITQPDLPSHLNLYYLL